MYTCYDCELFGAGCEGMIPPEEYRNNIENFCKKFKLVRWRMDMFKDSGTRRLSTGR
jgi:hypothetical protein